MRRAMEIQNDSASEDGGSVHSRPAFSGPLVSSMKKSASGSSKKSARFRDDVAGDDDGYVEITLDVRDDSVSIQEIRGAVDPETALLASQLEKQSGARRLTSQLSSKLKQVSQELRRVASLSRKDYNRFDRTKSTAARALQGLQFINKSNVGDEGWPAIEKRFDKLAIDGLLPRSRFGQCIGMSEKEFAGELYDALARRRGIVLGMISKNELKEFWQQLSDQSFDARLQTFFDMRVSGLRRIWSRFY